MEIWGRSGYLALRFDLQSQQSHITLVPTLGDILSTWGPSTRVSPIYGVKEYGTSGEIDDTLPGRRSLALVGPIDPSSLPPIPDYSRLWLTLGLFNIVVETSSAERELRDWCDQIPAPRELWTLQDGVIVETAYFAPVSSSGKIDVAHFLATATKEPELLTSISEYCTAMATALSRSEAHLPEIRLDLCKVHDLVVQTFSATPKSQEEVYGLVGFLAHLNGGLSRFTAQALSGVSPIAQTECHFWIHSLLGTGVANLVLHRFASFVMSKLDSKRVPARLRALAHVSDAQQLDAVPVDYWDDNHIEKVNVPASEQSKPLVPLTTYFSGRDGFRSGLTTISAPLAAISACNSRRWSLMTMTHEISHILVRGAMATLFPDPRSAEGGRLIEGFLKNVPKSKLEALQFYLLETVVAINQTAEKAAGGTITKKWDVDNVAIVLDQWHHEIEELMVHVFDFLYFYGQNTERYIKAIWLTWGVIPNVVNRVNEYVVRTLCASLVRHLRREEAEEFTRQEVLNVLKSLKEDEAGGYVDRAFDLLNDNERWPLLQSSLAARKGLVKVVRGFLYSERFAQELRGDTAFLAKAGGHAGYKFTSGKIGTFKVQNPLGIVEEYTDSMIASDVQSLWLLYTLAFAVEYPVDGI